MGEVRFGYNCINIIVIIITTILFVLDFKNVNVLFSDINWGYGLIILITVLIVHILKAGRMYLTLYGSDIGLLQYLKTYCKVTPVSVVIPFKMGEFFRMYCYGQIIENYLKGIVIILLDRFMDTLALVSMIVFVWIFSGGNIMPLVYLLLVFLVFVVCMYFMFPGLYRFWKGNILRAKATENKIVILKVLETLNIIYQEIEKMVEGRGIILYFMSLVAWTVEMGSILILNDLFGQEQLNKKISEYLSSAMNGNQSVELKRFVFISVILMIAVYIVIKIIETFLRKKECR